MRFGHRPEPKPTHRDAYARPLPRKPADEQLFRPDFEAQAPLLASPQRHHRESVYAHAPTRSNLALPRYIECGVYLSFMLWCRCGFICAKSLAPSPLCVAEAPSLVRVPLGCLNAPLRLLSIDSRETAIDGVAELGSASWRGSLLELKGRWHILQGPASYEEALELTSGMPQGLLQVPSYWEGAITDSSGFLYRIMGTPTSSWNLS